VFSFAFDLLELDGQDLRREPIETRKATLASLLRQARLRGLVSKRLGSPYVSGRTRHWRKFKNPAAPAVKREAEEEWG
jgi:ATP-dependent DNA ligase